MSESKSAVTLVTAAGKVMGEGMAVLSDDAGYIAGQNMRVDGGLTRSI
jgi:hypothetical protein